MLFKKGDLLEGKIIDFTHQGKGVLKKENFTIFVKEGLIGDRVKVEIEEVKRNYAIASLVEIIKESRDRINKFQDLRESKGGIPLINYRYSKQLEWKTSKVREDLERIARLDKVKVNKIIGMDNPFRYRNHTQIPVGESRGKSLIGFYQTGSNYIIDMEGSILHKEIGDRIINIIRRWMEEYKIRAYNRRRRKGILRHIGIRTNYKDEAMLILVTGSNNLPYKDRLIEELKKENIVSIYQNINRSRYSATYGKKYKKLYGQDSLVDYIGDYKFKISPNSFFQVNRSQAKLIYDRVIEYLKPRKEDIVYDLYSGIGTISLYIAKQVKKVYGIEVVEEAIEDGRVNAKLNEIENVEFIKGKAEEVFPQMLGKGVKGNKIVLDPPRKGVEKEVLEGIIGLNPETIVYVSCNPSTLARDVKTLVENGYKLEEVQPVDMFPHTAHVETVIGLVRELS